MNNFVMKLKVIIFWLLSRSTIFNISNINGFGEMRIDEARRLPLNEAILSFISLGLGSRKIHILSFSNEKFKVRRIQKFSCDYAEVEEEIDSQYNKYKDNIIDKSEEEKLIELDFIKYKISQCQSIINTSEVKVNFYFAFLVFILTMILQKNEIIRASFELPNKSIIVIIIILAYCLLNCILLVLSYYKVSNFSRSKFSNLKETPAEKKRNTHILSYYYDWRNIHYESPFRVTYVKQIQRYFKLVLIFIILFYGVISLNIGDLEYKSNELIIINEATNKEQILKTLMKVNNLQNNNVTVITSKKNSDTILDQLNFYCGDSVDFKVIHDENVGNEYKIILEEE